MQAAHLVGVIDAGVADAGVLPLKDSHAGQLVVLALRFGHRITHGLRGQPQRLQLLCKLC